jgi:hypothetical protein
MGHPHSMRSASCFPPPDGLDKWLPCGHMNLFPSSVVRYKGLSPAPPMLPQSHLKPVLEVDGTGTEWDTMGIPGAGGLLLSRERSLNVSELVSGLPAAYRSAAQHSLLSCSRCGEATSTQVMSLG